MLDMKSLAAEAALVHDPAVVVAPTGEVPSIELAGCASRPTIL